MHARRNCAVFAESGLVVAAREPVVRGYDQRSGVGVPEGSRATGPAAAPRQSDVDAKTQPMTVRLAQLPAFPDGSPDPLPALRNVYSGQHRGHGYPEPFAPASVALSRG